MNIPNILTFSRLVVALFIGLPFLIWDRQTAAMIAFVFFALGSVTDFFDGYLARKLDQVSELGRMMDPIADKAIVMILLAVMLGLYGLNAWVVIPASVIMFREVLVSGMREFLGDRAVELKVTNLAKWKTTAQMVALAVLLLGEAMINATIVGFGAIFLGVAAVLTAITGFDYARKAVALLS